MKTKIEFNEQIIECRKVQTYPSRFNLGDIIVGPQGTLLKVVTVQNGCPIWEHSKKTKTAVVFELQDSTIIPVSEMHGKYEVLRPCA